MQNSGLAQKRQQTDAGECTEKNQCIINAVYRDDE
jgi:hypothetical protein